MRLTFRAMLFSLSLFLCFFLWCGLCRLKSSLWSLHVIKSERQRYGCVEAHQHRDVGDPGMTEGLDRAIVRPRELRRAFASAVAVSRVTRSRSLGNQPG